MPNNRHHIFFNKAQYRKHELPNLVREHPINIQPMDILQHRELHAHTIGGLAVMSNGLARETLDFLRDLPLNYGNLGERRLPFLKRELYNFDYLSHRAGALGKEATYFARVMEHQLGFIEGEQ